MPGDDLAAELLAAVCDADPLSGSLFGLPGYDALLPDFSEESEADHARTLASIATRAEQSTETGRDETERQTLDFVRCLARGMADAAAVPIIEFTISDTFAAPVGSVFASLPKVPVDTDERREGYLERLRGLPGMLDTVVQRHADGARQGRTAVARLAEAAIAQLTLMIEDPTAGAMARTDSDADFASAAAVVIEEHTRPALAAYRDALRTSVLPTARDDEHPGLCYLPDGETMYRVLARQHTSMDYTPEELHAMGREIVDQVLEEIVETGSALFGVTDVPAIFERLADPSLRYRSREEMLAHAQRVVTAAEAEAPKWFATVPDVSCDVAAVPEAEEAGMAGAYYMPGSLDGSRPGTYYLNTSQPEKRHRYVAEDMAFHEAVPGHHFQLTIAMESKDLVPARQVLYDTACAEGWGLYSERLADEMGLYSDDLARMGLFTADSWRACRLVVDTGLHALGWSRQQAIDWMASHTPLPRLEVETEIDRYISYPGQALAYMVGRREIVRLRTMATEQLGDRFDLREFHDMVLRAGILPLPALARTVERWVERLTP
ncbi:MAG TPA: DUF885 domain-containing protein [Acidimicrobiales bacterium]|jgi:uncharacterized protein (DUF885 family)|nr:DUF885 domain-containing protein [Acidimicrobiales bacterium]